MKLLVAAALTAATGTIIAVYSFSRHEAPHSHRPENRLIVQQGKRLYEANCASCHGKNLQGQFVLNRRRGKKYILGPAHDQRGHTWQHTHRQLFDIIKYGSRPSLVTETRAHMPSFKWVLTDEEIWAVLSYIEAHWPKHIRAKHNAIEDGDHQ